MAVTIGYCMQPNDYNIFFSNGMGSVWCILVINFCKGSVIRVPSCAYSKESNSAVGGDPSVTSPNGMHLQRANRAIV